jgi:teichuronic acid biosynthesis glycosyltransferase TuaG
MISILMPIYNGIEFIEESLSSVLSQTYNDWEIIIGINGHPKNSNIYQQAKKYEEKDKRIRIYDFTIKGKSRVLNEMIKYCNYNWVSLLDVDDIWLPDKLMSQIEYMNKDYDVIGTKCRYFGDSNIELEIPTGDISKFNFLSTNPIINSSCLVKKEHCYWEIEITSDYDLWLRLWKSNKKFYNVNSVQVLHRIQYNSAFNAKGNHLNVPFLIKKYL